MPRHRPYSARNLRELREEDRPREKLLKHGPEHLTEAELVAIALGSGIPGQNVLDLAQSLVQDLGGLDGLARADAKQLQLVPGLGPAKSAQLAAAIEIGRRLRESAPEDRPLLTSAAAVFAFVGARNIGRTSEMLYVMALDTRGRALGEPATVAGGIDNVPARAADVFREAIVRNAASIVLAHNHPSGDSRPSPADVRVTTDLIAAGELFDIQVIDHVVVGQNRFTSMRDEGLAFRGRSPRLR